MAKTRKPTPSRRPPPKRPTPTPRNPPAKATPATSRTALYLALAAVVLAAAVAIGIAASRGDDEPAAPTADACAQLRADVEPVTPVSNPPELGSEVQAVTITGAPLTPFPSGGDIPECAIGTPAPAVTGASFYGTPVSITPADGTPTLVLFVAHWCPHCQAEVPLLADWIAKGDNPPDVDIVTVSTGVDPSRPNYPPSAWLESVNWPTPVLADDAAGSAGQAYGLRSFPYYVVLDGDGIVVDRFVGEVDPAALGTRITEALA